MEKRIEKLEMAVNKLVTSETRSLNIQESLRDSMKDIAASLKIFNDHMVESKILNAAHLKFEENTVIKLSEYDMKRESDLNKVYSLISKDQKKVGEVNICVSLMKERTDRLRGDIKKLQKDSDSAIKTWKSSTISLFTALLIAGVVWLFKGKITS